ncbi:hypothetical protein C798_23505 [Herbaspirillum rubrisubalbicans Os34]|uniref:DUF6602 domain-containing protein n=1 Tax=Herbaspirillum rubrisubalbicans Os34 TaxID=1235827 RepID=A0A6M3ZX06_9BURK|nr:DUF6602 domain-containing protein [Herbaspirillum rubrisubalbicans]QJQ03086.1 hypothetical protein C798_23505 [Herbaspirillum rubrisubalbicans Os34]
MNKSTALRRHRKTRLAKQEDEEFARSEARTRKWFTDTLTLVANLRRKDRTFHGLSQEFRFWKEVLLTEYRKSRDIGHARDVGAARENILRGFLTGSGFLPKKYGVTEMSTRVASTSGHVSGELDLVIYDTAESIALMQQQKAFQVLPVECTYGTIQVKSRLNRKNLKEAFENIASFKRLDSTHKKPAVISGGNSPYSFRPFGLIFAYESELSWPDLVEEVKTLCGETESHLICNSIFILSEGHMMPGSEARVAFHNSEIAELSEVVIHGRPDRADDVLYSFYYILMELLRATNIGEVPFNAYYNVPLVAGKYSYEFLMGPFVEVMQCGKHGAFAKEIASQNIEKLINWCQSTESFDWEKLNVEIFFAEKKKSAQPGRKGNVFVYNPKELPLDKVLAFENELALPDGTKAVTKAIDYDAIHLLSTRRTVLVPRLYLDEIIDPCPKCKSWEAFIVNNQPPRSGDS